MKNSFLNIVLSLVLIEVARSCRVNTSRVKSLNTKADTHMGAKELNTRGSDL